MRGFLIILTLGVGILALVGLQTLGVPIPLTLALGFVWGWCSDSMGNTLADKLGVK